ncbi:otopetrin-2-like [Limulus polyphemus]|uniref:Otopetrin-2-like n=1 Tax=Limulus polyphemus TaxID=6850 RepID=A0ABM1RX42_LIMPO|nr:otopetrin-2-like [Limulus polyphemus]
MGFKPVACFFHIYLTEITPPLASPTDSMPSENNPLVTPKPISMHRSASFGTPGVQADRRSAKPDLPSPGRFPIKGSEDSGLGTNTNFNPASVRLQTHPSVEIQHTPLSRNSSFFGSCSSLPTNNVMLRKDGRAVTWQQEIDGLVKMLSAVYAKLLVVMGLCFPLAEVISHKIPTSYYEKKKFEHASHCGSFYLRLGAVAFGIGSMIYSALEFGQFFEIDSSSPCYNLLYGLTPCTRMTFTFIQMYFIFLNSRNLSVWLHVLVQETKHEIVTIINPNHTDLIPSFVLEMKDMLHGEHSLAERSVDHEMYVGQDCRRTNILGQLVQDASSFLFPCTIEYSLICAAILYIMWKNIGKTNSRSEGSGIQSSRHRDHYTVDCTKANKGLFTGIMVLVSAIISLILFFVLISKESYKSMAVMEVHVVELALYTLTSLAVVVALVQVRRLKYNPNRSEELDNILLIIAQGGLYLFTMFNIIGGHFTMDQNTVLVLLSALACLIQGTLQTIFILDASRRYCRNSDQMRKKPGREMVTFLLVCNFAMWSINTLETRRADSNPVQMNFYGFWAWTIITHVTTPLTIFFRFHSTVCLCDIWKRSYKVRSDL